MSDEKQIENNANLDTDGNDHVSIKSESDGTGAIDNSVVKTDSVNEPGSEGSEKEEENTKTFTQKQVEELVQREKAIAKRRAERHARELENTLMQQQSSVNEQSIMPEHNPAVPLSDNHVWDDVFGWIPSTTTREQYAQMVVNAVGAASRKNVAQSNDNRKAEKHTKFSVSDDLMDQYDKCCVDHDDAEAILATIPLDIADYAARLDKKNGYGIENIYRMQKENPKRIFDICKMSDLVDKQRALLLLSQEMENKRKLKTKTNATPQPIPVGGGGGTVIKEYHDMSYEEKKAYRQRKERKK